MYGIGRCRMAANAGLYGKCRTVRRNAGRMATLLPRIRIPIFQKYKRINRSIKITLTYKLHNSLSSTAVVGRAETKNWLILGRSRFLNCSSANRFFFCFENRFQTCVSFLSFFKMPKLCCLVNE